MRAPTCFRWVHFRNVGGGFLLSKIAITVHMNPHRHPDAIDNIPISGKRVIIAARNSMHPLVEYHGSAMPFALSNL